MSQTVANNASSTVNDHRLSIQFDHDADDRGRDHVVHPISESQPKMNGIIPLTKTNTTIPLIKTNTTIPLTKTNTTIPLTKTNTTDSSKSRRSTLAAFAERFRSRSRSHSRSRSRSKGPSRNSLDASDEVEEFRGEYADVARAQALFMDRLREEQAKNNITRNVDGLPIPPPAQHERRRSSLAHILGMDKPLLAF
ncbi:hypothetical protein BGZ54_008634 [Gamsiella multidivaricata]|nr:hypothetical protein BGZ54_008634 [Gamsiella multidivaricata]